MKEEFDPFSLTANVAMYVERPEMDRALAPIRR